MKPNTVLTPAEKRKPPAAGRAASRGVPNKVTREVGEMITQASTRPAAWLPGAMRERPKTAPAFLTLVRKVLPLPGDGRRWWSLQIQRVERVIVEP